jgi:drug/metabolite transporter (DMT)-like permease
MASRQFNCPAGRPAITFRENMQTAMPKNYTSLYVVFAASLWGLDAIVLRPALYAYPVSLVVFIETGIVALLLSPFFAPRLAGLRHLDTHTWLAFLAVAVFGGAIGTLAITKALFFVDYINLSIVVLMQKLQPIFAIVLAWLFLGERPGRTFFVWSAVAIGGAYVMTFGLVLPDPQQGSAPLLAAAFALLAAASFAASTVFSKRGLRNVRFGTASYLRFLMTFAILIPLVLVNGEIGAISTLPVQAWKIFAIIALTSGGPALFLYYYGLKRITASVAAIAELAFPLSAVLLEFFLRGNLLAPIQWLGVFLLITAIYQVSRSSRGDGEGDGQSDTRPG